jgi:hypothetical protein
MMAVYPSLEAAVEAYVDLPIDSMRYRPAWLAYRKDGDADNFLAAVCAAAYATGPAFKVELEIEHQQNILHAVEMARNEAPYKLQMMFEVPRASNKSMAEALLSRVRYRCNRSGRVASVVIALRPLLLHLRRDDSVLGSFSDPEFHHLLSGDLDCCACRRIAPHACLPVYFDQPSDSRQHEHAILLDFRDGGLVKVYQHRLGRLFRHLALVCQRRDHLRLRHHCCSPNLGIEPLT